MAETLVLTVPFVVAHEQFAYARIEFSALLAAITATFSVLVPYVLVGRGIGDRARIRWLGYVSPLVGVVILLVVGSPRSWWR